MPHVREREPNPDELPTDPRRGPANEDPERQHAPGRDPDAELDAPADTTAAPEDDRSA
jgi:hypothetical protein